MEAQWIVIICAIIVIIVITCCRLCFLFLQNREPDKSFENPSKTKTPSKSSILTNGSIKSLVKDPSKAETIRDWLTDTPQKYDPEPKNEEKLRGGTTEFAPLKPNQENESKVDVDSDTSENEALLFETTEKEPNNRYENINDFEKVQSTLDGANDEDTSQEDKKMLLRIMNNEVDAPSDDRDIEAYYSENVLPQMIKNSKFEVMRNMTQESNIHTSDTLPMNIVMTNINELIKQELTKNDNENDDSILSSSIMKKDSKQESKFEVEVKECSAVSSNVQIIEHKSSSVEVSNTKTETQTVFQQSSSSVEHFERQRTTMSETDL